MQSLLEFKIEQLFTFSLAAQQNAYPLFRTLNLTYLSLVSETPVEFRPYRQLVVKLVSEPELFNPQEWLIDEILPGQVISLQNKPLNVAHDTLLNLTEEMRVSLQLKVYESQSPDVVLAEEQLSISVLPANFWGGESRQPDLLAAFVKPNGVYV